MLNNQERAEFINKNKEIILSDLNKAKSYNTFIKKYSNLFYKWVALDNNASWKNVITNAMQISMIPQTDKSIAKAAGISVGTVYNASRGSKISNPIIVKLMNAYPCLVLNKIRDIKYIEVGGWIQLNYHVGDVVDINLVNFISKRGSKYKYSVQYNDEDIFMVEHLDSLKILKCKNTCIINLPGEEDHYKMYSNDKMYDDCILVKIICKDSNKFVMEEN